MLKVFFDETGIHQGSAITGIDGTNDAQNKGARTRKVVSRLPANPDTWTYRLVRKQSVESEAPSAQGNERQSSAPESYSERLSNGRDSRFGLARPVQLVDERKGAKSFNLGASSGT